MDLQQRLDEGKVVSDDCWRWSGEHTNGWGTITVLGRKQRVHRVAFEVYVGALGPDEDVRQTCTRYRDCWRPEHLQKVDGSAIGQRVPRKTPKNAKLNPDKVREIRRRLKEGGPENSHTAIAKDFGISDVLVHYVEQKKVWAHVPDEDAPKRKIVRRPVKA